MKTLRSLLVFATIATAAASGMAQQPGTAARKGDITVAQATTACRKDVKDYLDTLRFLRQTAGSDIGDKVADGYASEAEVSRIAATQGDCAAAQLLRDKGLRR